MRKRFFSVVVVNEHTTCAFNREKPNERSFYTRFIRLTTTYGGRL